MADGVDASGACGRFIHPTEFLCAATIDGGEGGDVLRGPDVGGCELRGGPGVDNLSGGRVEGPGNGCILDGGPGADFIAGGGRAGDVVSYRDRVNPVRVSLGPPRNNDGEVGEHDTIVGVRNVWTGAGDDVVVGDSHANWVFAGAGRDLAGAGRGNDDVTGGPGPGRGLCGVDGHDRIFGGFGNDILRGRAGNDRIDGGPGRDLASGDRGNDTLRGDRGRDTLKGRVGNDILLARDGQVDRVGGGTGYDRARIDLGLDTRSSIERLF
jgi:Ca2+-binding RTX toxin-like protein